MRTTVILLLFSLFPNPLSPTHNRAGAITFRQIESIIIEASIITYAKTSSFPADGNGLQFFGNAPFKLNIAKSIFCLKHYTKILFCETFIPFASFKGI